MQLADGLPKMNGKLGVLGRLLPLDQFCKDVPRGAGMHMSPPNFRDHMSCTDKLVVRLAAFSHYVHVPPVRDTHSKLTRGKERNGVSLLCLTVLA